MTITADTALASFEDTPSIAAVLRSPNFLVRETLAGLVTALALIPEVISFSFI
jgi:SulP family sulfate permease